MLVTSVFYAQCNLTQTLTYCDITIVGDDGSGNPNGFVNLFTEYNNANPGNEIPIEGNWTDPSFTFAINAAGDLFIWDLKKASKSLTDYVFVLETPACGSDPKLTVNVVIGPYSGDVLPGNPGDANAKVCAEVSIPGTCEFEAQYDLSQALQSLPSGHVNGTWEQINIVDPVEDAVTSLKGSVFTASVKYQEGAPLEDTKIFEFRHTVESFPGSGCVTMTTDVTIEVVRQVSSGFPNELNICEQDLQDGLYDNINLLDNDFLVEQDIEGTWVLVSGQIDNGSDSNVDLGKLYDDLYASKQRFGSETYEFTYQVENRSNVCEDKESTIKFTFYEKLRAFQQDPAVNNEFCVNDVPPSKTFDLFDLLQFTTENGVEYKYNKNECTSWSLVETTAPSDSDLGLMGNTFPLCTADPQYSYKGTVNLGGLTNQDAGTYTFSYTVIPEYNATPLSQITHDSNCQIVTNEDHPCSPITAEVTLILNPINYAGDDTSGLQFCEDSATIATPLDLTTLLQTNGVDAIFTGAGSKWEDLSSGTPVEITNPLVTLPPLDGKGSLSFSYRYTTPPTVDGCVDTADLQFTIFEKYNSGTLNVSSPYSVCTSQPAFDLFTLLKDADTNGTWTDPDNNVSTGHNFNFDPKVSTPGIYTYTVPENPVGSPDGCPSSSTQVAIGVIQNSNPGSDTVQVICVYDELELNLYSLLGGTPDKGGVFVDVDGSNGAFNPSTNILTTKLLPGEGVFRFEYEFNSPSCPRAFATVTINNTAAAFPGTSATVDICKDAASINLFDSLGGTPFTPGKWYNEEGDEVSSNNIYNFVPSNFDAGTHVFSYEVNGVPPCNAKQNATVTVNVFDVPNAGQDVSVVLCRSAGVLNLEDYLDTGADKGGAFSDDDNTGALNGNFLDMSLLGDQTYNFTYTVSNSSCTPRLSLMSVRPTVVEPPTVASNQTFCLTDGRTLGDVFVNTAFSYNWYASQTSDVVLPETTVLLPKTSYYVANQDGDCESNRVLFTPNLLSLDSPKCDPCIGSAMSPNNDGVNDVLDLCGLPVVFPNYEFKIFNRHGTIVFDGNKNKPDFIGKSNVSMSLGKQLPSGVYFYVFDPKDNETKPFQGNFYLSR